MSFQYYSLDYVFSYDISMCMHECASSNKDINVLLAFPILYVNTDRKLTEATGSHVLQVAFFKI